MRCQIVQPLFCKFLAALLLPVLFFLVPGLVILTLVSDLHAGTTGKLTGTVLDQDGRPVVAATIVLTGTRYGAYSAESKSACTTQKELTISSKIVSSSAGSIDIPLMAVAAAMAAHPLRVPQ